MTDHRPTQAQREAAYSFMIKRWPDAHSLRWEGKCPACKRWFQWSYVTDHDKPRGTNEMTCGFFCSNCKWGNGGSRPVDELEGEE